jgi:raffinose/stachyose/melibiose transport system permease protein
MGGLWTRTLDHLDWGLRRVLLVFVTVISLAPFAWVLLSSFKTNRQVLTSALSLPTRFSLDAYREILARTRFPLFFANTLIVSAVATVAAITLFGMAAYVLARYEFPGRRAIYALLISTVLISLIPMQQPIVRVVRTLGLFDSIWGLTFVHTARGLPIVIFVMHSFFKAIPRELEEAAIVDGASFPQTSVRVMLPLALPAAASAGVIVFLNSYNDFLFALLLTQSEESRTLSYALRFFVNMFSYDFPTLFAAITLTLLPSIAIYVLLQEQIRRGLMGGALRG